MRPIELQVWQASVLCRAQPSYNDIDWQVRRDVSWKIETPLLQVDYEMDILAALRLEFE